MKDFEDKVELPKVKVVKKPPVILMIRFHDKHYYDTSAYSGTATYAGLRYDNSSGFLNT